MFDVKTNLVLKILQKECKSGGYKVVDKADIISALPSKYRMDEEQLDHVITFLERSECIHVKYDDDSVYCLCILPLGNQITEKEEKNKKDKKSFFYIFLIIIASFSAILGGILGNIIARFIP